jgi:hypothetical protein
MFSQVIIINKYIIWTSKRIFFNKKNQFRGNEPYHRLLWIKYAPKYGINGNDKM